jgi:hypothetical protein
MPKTRFRITFGGKSFPEYRPASVTIPSQSEDVAREWAARQLEVWGLSIKEVKVEIALLKEDPPKKEDEKEPKKEQGKDGKKGRRVKKPKE